MKRRYVTGFIVFIFLTWNGLTYFFLASRPSGQIREGGPLEERLDILEAEVQRQIKSNEALLKDLQQQRSLLAHLGQKPDKVDQPPSATNAASPPAQKPVDNGYVANKVTPQPVAPDKVFPVLVFACNRVTVKRNLDQLIKYRPTENQFPIVVSQDCGHGPTADAVRSYGSKVTLIQHPDLSEIQLPWNQRKFQGYFKIARHYKWALNQIFMKMNFDVVIIVEDDLNVSPDFFEYFRAMYPILHSDPTLWCVSAWNDNGKSNMVSDDSELVYRSDFFPGLGWMLEKKVWLELENGWPKTFWDDWMRQPVQRKERACIRPEISRTSTFGKIGVSKGQFFEKHLKFIKLNDKFVEWSKKDLSYLLKENYDQPYVRKVYSLPLLTVTEATSGARPEHREVRVQYTDKNNYKVQAKMLGIMEDLKSGVGRGAYRGIISFMLNGRRVYYAPPPSWSKYDLSWN